MNARHLLTAGTFLLIMTLAPPCCAHDPLNPNAKATPSLREFYQGLVEHYDPSALPTDEERMRVMHQVQAAPADEISAALPAIFAALAHQDDRVKLDACAALIAISLRSDSAALLTTHINRIGDLLTSQDERLQWSGLEILGYLKPLPPPEAVGPMLAFLKRTDANQRAQGGAVGFLVSFAPDRPESVKAVLDFLDRPLERDGRIQALNALGTTKVKDPNIIDRVIAALDDRDPAVRFTAADVLPRMGQQTLLLAQPKLERLAADPNEVGNVKDEARKALDQIHQSTNRTK
jgi:HEAT repeat protein